MKKVEFGTQPENKKQSVFIALYGQEKLYKHYTEGLSEEARNTDIPVILLLNRWDGKVGLPGGYVEKGETLTQAAVREAFEELGVTIREEELIPVVSHEFGIVTHLFAVKKEFSELVQIQRNVFDAPHYGSEITGTFLAHIKANDGGYRGDKGFASTISSSLAKSLREELVHLVLAEQMMNHDLLEQVCKDAGFELDQLLA